MGYCLDNLNEVRDRAYKNAVDKGFFQQPIDRESEQFLIVTELSEAINALRDKRHTNLDGWTTSDFSFDEEYMHRFEMCCKDTFEDELADTLLRAMSLAGALKIDLKLADEIKCGRISMGVPTNPTAAFFLRLMPLLTDNLSLPDIFLSLNRFIGYLITWCWEEGIEIDLHVYLKMIYNEHRPYLNGKSF